MATPENTLITRAEITSTATPATLRRLFTIDGEAVDIGDTGLRDITATMNAAGITSGRLLLGRVGDLVMLFIVDLVVAAGAPSSLVVQNQSRANQTGFYPKYGVTGRGVATSGTGTVSGGAGADLYVNNQLGIVLHGVTPGVTYQGAVAWRTDAAWPNVLPGVADGQPVA